MFGYKNKNIKWNGQGMSVIFSNLSDVLQDI